MKTRYNINIKPFANFAKIVLRTLLLKLFLPYSKAFVNFVNPLRSLRLNPAQLANKTLWLSIFLLVSTLSQAQEKISLEKAIALAKSNNIDLKIADKEIEKQTVLKKTAFQPDPLQVQYQGGQFNSADYDHNVSVQQFFPMGNITKANRQLQEELVKLAEKRKALSAYEIEKAVTLSYYQYLYGVSIQKLNSELNDIYTKFLKNA